MQFAVALLSLAGIVAAAPNPVAAPMPQGVTASITPSSTPAGCSPTYDNGASFQIGIVNGTTASKVKRFAIPNGLDPNKVPGNSLVLTLEGGLLHDQIGRTGYVASNGQLQFDEPVQDGAIYTAGFSACPNNTLALADAVWYECLSGTYYNLYDASVAEYCSPIYLEILPYSDSSSSASATAAVSGVTQVTDGQLQAATTVAAVSEITDGQLQAATTVAAVSQITDGQVQAATATAAATSVAAQATATGAVVSQVTDGQIQAPTNATSTLTPFTGAAVANVQLSGATLALVAGLIGLGALL